MPSIKQALAPTKPLGSFRQRMQKFRLDVNQDPIANWVFVRCSKGLPPYRWRKIIFKRFIQNSHRT